MPAVSSSDTKLSQRFCAVFCSAGLGVDPAFSRAATQIGTLLAQSNVGILYGGSKDGLMGCVANGALAHGGHVVGVLPACLQNQEIAHPHIQQCLNVDTMSQRKDHILNNAQLCLVLPGGLGTLDEFLEVLTLNKLGVHRIPVIVLNTNGFFDGLFIWLETIAHQKLAPFPKDCFVVARTPEEVGAFLQFTRESMP